MPTRPTRRSVLRALGAGVAQTLFQTQLNVAQLFAEHTGEPGKLDFSIKACSPNILHISIAPVNANPPEREPGVLDSIHETSLNVGKDFPQSISWGQHTIRVET
jgi:hypothetical protein